MPLYYVPTKVKVMKKMIEQETDRIVPFNFSDLYPEILVEHQQHQQRSDPHHGGSVLSSSDFASKKSPAAASSSSAVPAAPVSSSNSDGVLLGGVPFGLTSDSDSDLDEVGYDARVVAQQRKENTLS